MSSPHETVLTTFPKGASDTSVRRLRELFGIVDETDPRLRWHGTQLATFRAHEVDDKLLECVRDLPGVLRVVHLPAARRLYSKENGRARQAVDIGRGVSFGDGQLTVIAGPCSVESLNQLMAAAEIVAEAGARALRGGVFKPRSSPYAFGGLGEKGLEYLALARQRTGLPVVTEALAVSHVELVASWADVIQIGSRNMSNFPLLFEAGANSKGLPVLLKRGLGASLEEFLEAAEYVLLGRLSTDQLEPGVILCERGIRTFAPALRFTLDVGAIPILQAQSHLPVIADPSHAAGERWLVPALGRAAVAAGANGLLIEVHPEPDRGWCDAAQSVDAPLFRSMMRDLNRYVASEVMCV